MKYISGLQGAVCAVLFSCFCLVSHAQLSKIVLQRDARGVEVRSAGEVTRVEVWSPRIVRVSHRPAGSVAPASLAVVAKPDEVQWNVSEQDGVAILRTAALEVRIDEASGRVRICDQGGAPILQEKQNGSWLSSVSTGSAEQTVFSGQKFELDQKQSFYGLGQHPELKTLDLAGHSVRLLQENGHVAVPVLLSTSGWLMLWDNPAVTQVDVGKTDPSTLSWQSEAGGGVDYYVAQGPDPDAAVAGYRWLTGAAPMFPRWTWGFWQSRERYKSQDEILGIASEYRKRKIPFDGIIQDWQYWPPLNSQTATSGWGSHEFDPARYPDPQAMMKTLHDAHVHMIISVWAKFDVTNSGVSIPNLRELEAVKGVYEPAIPYVYPAGQGKWYDAFNAAARQIYWKQLNEHLFHAGVDGWWLDASEAELSGRWGEFRDFRTAQGPGALVYNAYPLEHTRAVYEGQRSTTEEKRVFQLTRSSWAGQQRNAAVTWSGDITGKWEVLREQIPAGLNFSASGIPYWNTDIGGFFGSNPDDPQYVELFTRWFQFGAFNPMFRVHGTDKPKEIWRFDPATQKVLTSFVELRYHLLPYIYSTSWRVTHEGYTMMRPLGMDFGGDVQARTQNNSYLFGPSLLAAPVTDPGVTERDVYLPAGTAWFDFWTGEKNAGGQKYSAAAPREKMPIFVRAGSILPYAEPMQYADENPDGPLELRIYPGSDAEFTLYEDEGDNYNYEHGAFATIRLRWNEKTQSVTIGARQGNFAGMKPERAFRLVVVRPGHGAGIASTQHVDREIQYHGAEVQVEMKSR